MKRQHHIVILAIFSAAMLLISCSDLKTNLPIATSATPQIHEQSWTDAASAGFHGKAIQSDNYDMRPCQQCHGSDYKGGTSGESCIKCHNKPGGPEYCATCHGSGLPPAPPTDLLGNTSNTARGVGAHQIHLLGTGTYSSHIVECSGCHRQPGGVYDTDHINSTGRAAIVFQDPLANQKSGGVTPVPSYNLGTLKCSNTFCHGSWRLRKSDSPNQFIYTDSVMLGASYAPLWNGGATQKGCGTCHDFPPTGHSSSALSNCYTCHGDVMNASGTISNKAKHINGKIDLVSGAIDFR